MEPSRKRRHSPLYPVLAAAALAGAFVSSCGVDLQEPIDRELQKIVSKADGGTTTTTTPPTPPDFIGGGAPYEALPFDGGTP